MSIKRGLKYQSLVTINLINREWFDNKYCSNITQNVAIALLPAIKPSSTLQVEYLHLSPSLQAAFT